MGRFHYLLGLLLLFICSCLWIASSLGKQPSNILITHGSCVCSEDNITVASNVGDIPSNQPEVPIKDMKPISEPNIPSYLPIANSHGHHEQPSIPLKLWQKAGSTKINDARQKDIHSWLDMNPRLRHEILTDDSADEYVREHYADYPDILDLYLSLPVPILKADLLRQLILYADGGIWSDLDVTCHRPIYTWIPEQYKNRTNAVVGLEFDGFQFSSWTIMTKPKTSHIVAVIKYVIDELKASAAQHSVTTAELNMTMISDVVDVTGPQAMTVALLQNLQKEMGVPFGRANITDIKEPTLFQDVLVLPNAAFASRQAGFPEDRGPYLVEHHYAGSWKNAKGGETQS
jgi:mannosyltransferase OCH1-like enzyme